jgi:hypothetical protein
VFHDNKLLRLLQRSPWSKIAAAVTPEASPDSKSLSSALTRGHGSSLPPFYPGRSPMASVRKHICIPKGITKSAWRCAPSEIASATPNRYMRNSQSVLAGWLEINPAGAAHYWIRWREAKRTDYHHGIPHEIRPFLQE